MSCLLGCKYLNPMTESLAKRFAERVEKSEIAEGTQTIK